MPAACSAAAIESFAWCTLYLCAWLRFLIHLPPPARSAAMRTQRPQRSVPPLVPMADRESCSSSFSISMQSCRNPSFVFFPPPPWMCAAARSAAGPAPRPPSRWWSAVRSSVVVRRRRRVVAPRARGCAARGSRRGAAWATRLPARTYDPHGHPRGARARPDGAAPSRTPSPSAR